MSTPTRRRGVPQWYRVNRSFAFPPGTVADMLGGQPWDRQAIMVVLATSKARALDILGTYGTQPPSREVTPAAGNDLDAIGASGLATEIGDVLIYNETHEGRPIVRLRADEQATVIGTWAKGGKPTERRVILLDDLGMTVTVSAPETVRADTPTASHVLAAGTRVLGFLRERSGREGVDAATIYDYNGVRLRTADVEALVRHVLGDVATTVDRGGSRGPVIDYDEALRREAAASREDDES